MKRMYLYDTDEFISILLWPLFLVFLFVKFNEGMYFILIFQFCLVLKTIFRIN